MGATMKAVALEAGVSIGTVDRVINSRGNVNEKTKIKVEQAIEKLGYESNLLARGLVKKGNPTKVAVVINSPQLNFYASELKRGTDTAAQKLKNYGFELEYHLVEEISVRNLANILEEIYEKAEICGLIVKPINCPTIRNIIDKFVDRGIPVITCATDIDNSKRTCFVGHNQLAEGRIAACLLGKMISRKSNIAIITGAVDVLGNKKAAEGFCSYIEEKLPESKVIGIFETYHSKITPEELLTLITKKDKIDAICIQAMGLKGIKKIYDFFKDTDRPLLCTFSTGDELYTMLSNELIEFAISECPFEQGDIAVNVLFNIIIKHAMPTNSFVEIESRIVVSENASN